MGDVLDKKLLKQVVPGQDIVYASLTDEDEDEIDHELTGHHEPFKGTVVSRGSVADLIVKVIASPHLHAGANLGVNKPTTDGRPASPVPTPDQDCFSSLTMVNVPLMFSTRTFTLSPS